MMLIAVCLYRRSAAAALRELARRIVQEAVQQVAAQPSRRNDVMGYSWIRYNRVINHMMRELMNRGGDGPWFHQMVTQSLSTARNAAAVNSGGDRNPAVPENFPQY